MVAVRLLGAVVGVLLGAAVIGPFEAVVILPALGGAAAVVVVFAALARRARRRLGRAEVVQVRGRHPVPELPRGDAQQHIGAEDPEQHGRG